MYKKKKITCMYRIAVRFMAVIVVLYVKAYEKKLSFTLLITLLTNKFTWKYRWWLSNIWEERHVYSEIIGKIYKSKCFICHTKYNTCFNQVAYNVVQEAYLKFCAQLLCFPFLILSTSWSLGFKIFLLIL